MAILKREVIGNQTLLLGDCVAVMPLLGRFDAVVTDPPYGQSYRAPKPRTEAASRRGLNGNWVRKGARPSPDRVIGDDGPVDLSPLFAMADHVLIWGVHRLSSNLPSGQWLFWDKRVDLPPIDQGDGEAAWVNREGPIRIIRHKWSGLIIEPGTEESRRVPGTSAAQARLHPTQKPIRVMRWSIEQFPTAKTILDPFLGSGTTLVACQRMGRAGTGIELDPDYFDIACRRVDEAARQPDLLIPETRQAPVQEGFDL